MKMPRFWLSSASLLLLVGVLGAGGAPGADVAALRSKIDALRIDPARLRWQLIPWLTDVEKARRLAKEEKRPIFFWISADDPLGRC